MLLCATAMDRRAASRMRAETDRTNPRRAHSKSNLGPPGGGDGGRVALRQVPALATICRPLFRRSHAIFRSIARGNAPPARIETPNDAEIHRFVIGSNRLDGPMDG